MPLVGDTGSDESVRICMQRAADALGSVDILINCAAQPGGQAPAPALAEITEALF